VNRGPDGPIKGHAHAQSSRVNSSSVLSAYARAESCVCYCRKLKQIKKKAIKGIQTFYRTYIAMSTPGERRRRAARRQKKKLIVQLCKLTIQDRNKKGNKSSVTNTVRTEVDTTTVSFSNLHISDIIVQDGK